MQSTESTGTIAVKSAFPVGMSGAILAGLTVDEWIAVLTVVYLLLMISHHIWRNWMLPYIVKRSERTRCGGTNGTNGTEGE